MMSLNVNNIDNDDFEFVIFNNQDVKDNNCEKDQQEFAVWHDVKITQNNKYPFFSKDFEENSQANEPFYSSDNSKQNINSDDSKQDIKNNDKNPTTKAIANKDIIQPISSLLQTTNSDIKSDSTNVNNLIEIDSTNVNNSIEIKRKRSFLESFSISQETNFDSSTPS